jgi:hypothetical protein
MNSVLSAFESVLIIASYVKAPVVLANDHVKTSIYISAPKRIKSLAEQVALWYDLKVIEESKVLFFEGDSAKTSSARIAFNMVRTNSKQYSTDLLKAASVIDDILKTTDQPSVVEVQPEIKMNSSATSLLASIDSEVQSKVKKTRAPRKTASKSSEPKVRTTRKTTKVS